MSTADSRRSWPQDQWLRRLAAHCWRYRRLTLMALGGSLLATAVTAVIPLIQRDIIDNAILAHRQPPRGAARGPVVPFLSARRFFIFSTASTYAATGAAGCPWTSSTA